MYIYEAVLGGKFDRGIVEDELDGTWTSSCRFDFKLNV